MGLLSSAWKAYVYAARTYLLSVLNQGIHVGELCLHEGGAITTFGSPSKIKEPVNIYVRDERFWTHILLHSDVGFSEAYMLQYMDLDNDDIKGALDIWLDNRKTMGAMSTPLYRLATTVSGVFNYFFGQTISAAKQNVIAGYDVSNRFFVSWLSKEMMYSNALFGPEEGGVRGDKVNGFTMGHLESAQLRKLHHVLTQARVKPGDRVLEWGTGWGGCAIEAATTFGCRVDTLTLSIEQKTLAEQRAKEAGVADRVTVHLMDYRKMPKEWKGQFDAFVAIEMAEHVGANWHATFFSLIDWALKPKNAAAAMCVTTQPESRYTSLQYTDFGRKYIWPGTVLPSVSAFVAAASKGHGGRLSIEGIEDQTPHYCRVLRDWRYRFTANWDDVIVDQIQEEYPELKDPVQLEAFRRKWLYIFDYAESGFARAYATSHMLTFVRDDMVAEQCD